MPVQLFKTLGPISTPLEIYSGKKIEHQNRAGCINFYNTKKYIILKKWKRVRKKLHKLHYQYNIVYPF